MAGNTRRQSINGRIGKTIKFISLCNTILRVVSEGLNPEGASEEPILSPSGAVDFLMSKLFIVAFLFNVDIYFLDINPMKTVLDSRMCTRNPITQREPC